MSTPSLENPHGDARFFAMYTGIVHDRIDPKKAGRVRVTIPGLMDEPASGWAWPIGSPGGGSKQSGMKWVPQVGAEVVVFFNGGDPDAPRYMPAQWGSQATDGHEAPGSVQDNDGNELSKDDAPDVHAFETANFVVLIDERDGHKGLVLKHKFTGDFLEYDGESYGWVMQATTGVFITCDGMFSVKATTIQLNDKPFQPGAGGI